MCHVRRLNAQRHLLRSDAANARPSTTICGTIWPLVRLGPIHACCTGRPNNMAIRHVGCEGSGRRVGRGTGPEGAWLRKLSTRSGGVMTERTSLSQHTRAPEEILADRLCRSSRGRGLPRPFRLGRLGGRRSGITRRGGRGTRGEIGHSTPFCLHPGFP